MVPTQETQIFPHDLHWREFQFLILCDNASPDGRDFLVGLTDRKVYQRANRPHVSAGPSDQTTQLGHLSHLDSRYNSRRKKYNSVQCRLTEKIRFLVLVPYREFVSPVTASILIALVQGLICVEFLIF
jgi:hypothetical protein